MRKGGRQKGTKQNGGKAEAAEQPNGRVATRPTSAVLSVLGSLHSAPRASPSALRFVPFAFRSPDLCLPGPPIRRVGHRSFVGPPARVITSSIISRSSPLSARAYWRWTSVRLSSESREIVFDRRGSTNEAPRVSL
jgi:hypothetical protein